MKIALIDQIEEAERHRDELAAAHEVDGSDEVRLDRAEGIVLTLRFVQTYEQNFRDFFASQQKGIAP